MSQRAGSLRRRQNFLNHISYFKEALLLVYSSTSTGQQPEQRRTHTHTTQAAAFWLWLVFFFFFFFFFLLVFFELFSYHHRRGLTSASAGLSHPNSVLALGFYFLSPNRKRENSKSNVILDQSALVASSSNMVQAFFIILNFELSVLSSPIVDC